MVFQEQQNGSSSSSSSARSSSEPEATLLNMLQPVPSQLLHVDYRGQKLTITLDSGATVSFWSPTLVRRLGLTLHPNAVSGDVSGGRIAAVSSSMAVDGR